MKQSKLMLAIEGAYVAYMVVIVWWLFPQWHAPVRSALGGALARWRRGRALMVLARSAPWVREAAQVRGRLPFLSD